MGLKILFMGGTPRGLELLLSLIKDKRRIVYACILKEDDHEAVKVSHKIKELCVKGNIPFKICKAVSPEQIKKILKLKPDVGFACSWRTILPPAFTNKIPFGCLTAHDSLLPRYRGFAPLNWAIINGEKKTGVTLFKINDGVVDSGEIFKQKEVKIGAIETASDVYPRIIQATVELYREFILAQEKGRLKWRRQDESKATYTCKRTPEDGKINWNMPAKQIFNLIRGISWPYPCAWTEHRGQRIRVVSASLPKKQLKYAGNIPGRIVSVSKEGILVLCGKGQVIIKKITLNGRRQLDADQVFTSIKTTFSN